MSLDDLPTLPVVTRQNIFDSLTVAKFPWWGRLGEIKFLDRLFSLASIPCLFRGNSSAVDEIREHRHRSMDWDDDWVFYDERFDLLHCSDARFFAFLAFMAHPVVQTDPERVKWLVETINKHLAAGGWVMVPQDDIEGRPTFGVERLELEPSLNISQRTVVALREYLSHWVLRDIRNAFDSAGVPVSENFDPGSRIRGERLRLVIKYLHSLDPRKNSDVERLLQVFAYVLTRATSVSKAQADTQGAKDAQADLDYFLPLLRSDGFGFENGRVIPISGLSSTNQATTPDTRRTTHPIASETTSLSDAPTAFISYSWDSEEHKQWVRELATRLRGKGVDVKLDHWELALGDGLPQFMETAVRANKFVLIILTPGYKKKSDNRQGGVGYEGNIMTAELFAGKDPRKFIPVLREAEWPDASPSWLSGKAGVDLRGNSYSEEQFNDLLETIHGMREKAPPLGPPPPKHTAITQQTTITSPPPPERYEPIRIVNIIASEVGTPRNDGTQGSALYAVPFQLSRRPSSEWVEHFINTWRMPPSFSTRHRPSIARIVGDRLILDGTTMDELASVHRDTLKLVLEKVNKDIAAFEQSQQRLAQERAEELRQHKQAVEDAAKRLSFD